MLTSAEPVSFETSDPGQAELAISQLWQAAKLRLTNKGSNFYLKVQKRLLSRLHLCSGVMKGNVEIETNGIKRYMIHAVKSGHLELRLRGGTYSCGPHTLTVFPISEDIVLRTQDLLEWYSVAVPPESLASHLEALLDHSINHRVSFYPLTSDCIPGTKSLLRLIEYLYREANQPDSLLSVGTLTARQLEKLFLTHLLEVQPHSLLDKLASGTKPAGVLHVHCCEEYIRTNLDKVLSIKDLAAIANTSVRTLYEDFRRHRGYSPMRFLRQSRLQRARQELMDRTKPKTVTEVAMRWYFSHLGRFSRLYYHTFGELPSQTVVCSNKFDEKPKRAAAAAGAGSVNRIRGSEETSPANQNSFRRGFHEKK